MTTHIIRGIEQSIFPIANIIENRLTGLHRGEGEGTKDRFVCGIRPPSAGLGRQTFPNRRISNGDFDCETAETGNSVMYSLLALIQ